MVCAFHPSVEIDLKFWDSAIICMEYQKEILVVLFLRQRLRFLLRRCSNGTTLLSKSVIENILTSAGQVDRKAQSMGEVSASPFECLSAVLLRDEVVATIKECVCATKHDFLHFATSTMPPFAMVLTAFPRLQDGLGNNGAMSGESFVLLCSSDDCVVIDSHRYMTGTLQDYIKGSHWAESIASCIFDKHGGMLDMMGCLSTGLHIRLSGRTLVSP